MNLDDIRNSQEELLDKSQAYFGQWYATEDRLLHEFTESEEDEEE